MVQSSRFTPECLPYGFTTYVNDKTNITIQSNRFINQKFAQKNTIYNLTEIKLIMFLQLT